MSLHIPKPIIEYPQIVLGGEVPVCEWQPKLITLISDSFENEDVKFNEEQFGKYMTYQKYFPFDLFPWEKFIFGLHNCTYWGNGLPRWSTLFGYVGRGTGKNGYLSFENFCLLTPINSIPQYHIDTFANSEDQAKTTFEELYDILESTPKMKKFFYWNKECITNLQTKSRYRFRTGNAKTKDSGRQGKVDFDEVHAYENYGMIEVATSGLGKKAQPRRTIISSDGDVREGPLDDYKQQGKDILNRLYEDNGFLPFMCCIESEAEIDTPDMWVKANPSLPYMPNLKAEMLRQYNEYKRQTSGNLAFPTKRLNYPMQSKANIVTEYKNLLATKTECIYDYPMQAIAGIDFASRRDFAAVGHLTKRSGRLQWKVHLFVLKSNPDLERIKAPLQDWEAKGLLTFVEGVEIQGELLCEWLSKEAEEKELEYIASALDLYRYGIMKKALNAMGFESGKDGNLKLVRPSDIALVAPYVMSALDRQILSCGDSPHFRWSANNVKVVKDKHDNDTFDKIEPKSRKTDAFQAFAAAMTLEELLPDEESADEPFSIDYA